jgi:hypothetical protein
MYRRKYTVFLLLAVLSIATAFTILKSADEVKIIPIGEGWSNNSVNAVVFRKNSLVTHKNMQYAAYYDPEQYLVLAKRKQGREKWTTKRTFYKGKASDAHNSISIMVDGKGYLHVAWDHHGNPLRYARSLKPGSLELTEQLAMTGQKEDNVTYPEFYKMPDGSLLFFYRYGASGRGDLIINKYDTKTRQWTQLQSNLIDGQGERNAYWQASTDVQGTIHVSWVWRESPDVASNHDLCYARSKDGGNTWEKSNGEKYTIPINVSSAEIAYPIPQNSELINQTSMATDSKGNPVIATYWRDKESAIPQYRMVYHDGQAWHATQIASRKTPFSLSGGGTKRIPISRPQILLWEKDGKQQAYLIFRDIERDDKVSVAVCNNFPTARWEVNDLTVNEVGSWEPSYDTEYWKKKGVLNLFVQKVEQADNEGVVSRKPETVSVLVWKPSNKKEKSKHQ